MKRLAVACLLSILVAGCTSSSTGVSPVDDGHGLDGPVQPGPEEGLPGGIVAKSTGGHGKAITVYDDKGVQLATAILPGTALFVDEGRRAAYDRSMTKFAYLAECDVHLSELDTANQYVPTQSWTPPQVFGQGRMCFGQPSFRPDGTLIAAAAPDGTVDDPGRLYQLDLDDPSAPPRNIGPGLGPAKPVPLKHNGPGDITIEANSRGKTIESVKISGYDPAKSFPDGNVGYQCSPAGDTSFVCGSTAEWQLYGSVAQVTVDRAAGRATVRQVLPAGESSKTEVKVIAAPDGRRLLVADQTGTYLTSLDGETPASLPVTGNGEWLFWN